MKENKKIAVVIPCFKVSKHILEVVKTIPPFIDDIIIVDDFCPEKSGNIIENLHLTNVNIIFHQKNKGVGSSMISGYKKALELKSDIIVKMDGDGQMKSVDIQSIVRPIIDNISDYTKGNRFYDFESLRAMPKIRLFGNSILSFLVKFSSGYWNIVDPTNGFTAINASALNNLKIDNISKRYFFEIDMLINLNIYSKTVTDISLPARYGNEKSNLNIFSVIIKFPFKIVQGLVKRIFYKYYLYNFNMASIYLLLGIPFSLFGIIFGIYRWVKSYLENIENSAGTIMLVALPIILGIQFILQAIQIDIQSIPEKKKS